MSRIFIGNVLGKEGPKGEPGIQGKKGIRGSRWTSGKEITGTSTEPTIYETGIADAMQDDFYLNTDTGNMYRCVIGGNHTVAMWVFVGNIWAFIPQVLDMLDSDSITDALSANQGRVLAKRMEAAGIEVKEIGTDDSRQIYDFALEIENVDTVITWSGYRKDDSVEGEAEPFESSMEYVKTGDAEKTEIKVTVKKTVNECFYLNQIKSSNAAIGNYKLNYESNREESETNIWKHIFELKRDASFYSVITEKSGDVTGTYFAYAFSKIKSKVRNAIFPITHAKAVWWNKMENKTVYQKVTELENKMEEIEKKMEAFPAISYGTAAPDNESGEEGDIYIQIEETE